MLRSCTREVSDIGSVAVWCADSSLVELLAWGFVAAIVCLLAFSVLRRGG